jgi:hypothetical protein
MRMLAALSVAAGFGLACCQGAAAFPVAPSAVSGVTTAAAPLQAVQYREYRTRHYVVKCYRALVIGPYRCHYYPRGW